MISQEIVTAVSGTYVYTEQGRRRCAGNELFAVGDAVTVIGSLVVGWRRRASASLPAVDDQYYRFADAGALKMYYLDTGFSAIVQTDGIAQPVDETTQETIDATLVLHCYNADAEYLVWFAEPESGDYYRCIVQKDGENLADFTSVFTDVPASGLTDAYIDSSGNLIWVAATDDGSVITMAMFGNDSIIDQKTYLYSNAETAINNRLTEYIDEATDKVAYSEANEQTYETIENCVFPRTQYWGTQFKAVAQELIIEPSTAHAIPSGSSFTIYDLWRLNAIVQVSANGSGSVSAKTHASYYGWQTGTISSETDWFLVSIAPEARIGWNYSFASGALIEAIIVVPDTLAEENTTSTKNAEHVTALVSANEIVAGTVSTAISTSKFVCTFNMPSEYTFGTVAPSYCDLTFTSGVNAGLTRTAMLDYWTGSDPTHYRLKFSPTWPYTPAAGDTFYIEVSFGTYANTETTCEPSMSVSLSEVEGSGTSSVGTDLGNGYSLNYSIDFAEPDGQSLSTQTVNKNGAVIYTTGNTAPQPYLPFGGWLSESGSLTGLLLTYGNKLIQAEDSDVTTTDFSLFSGTVTKRFVAK